MKKILLLAAVAFFSATAAFAQNNVGINNANPVSSAALMVDTAASGPQGILVPRMTQVRRNAIASPATGLMIFQTDNTPGFYYYSGTAWVSMGPAATTLPNVEINSLPASVQAISTVTGTNNYTTVAFSPASNANTALSGGNSWNGTTFTVGATGAGWYLVNCQLMCSANSTNAPITVGVQAFLDKNAAITNTPPAYSSGTYTTPYPYSVSTYDLSTSSTYIKNSTKINTVIYLAASDYINIRAQSLSNSATAYTTTDGSTNISIVRIR